MTKDELLAKLKAYKAEQNKEGVHVLANQDLLDYIGDSEIADAFHEIEVWYA